VSSGISGLGYGVVVFSDPPRDHHRRARHLLLHPHVHACVHRRATAMTWSGPAGQRGIDEATFPAVAQRGHHERLGRLGQLRGNGDGGLGSSYDGVHPSGDIEREVKLSNYRGVTPAVPSHNWEQVFAKGDHPVVIRQGVCARRKLSVTPAAVFAGLPQGLRCAANPGRDEELLL